MASSENLHKLCAILDNVQELELAVLIGSRVNDKAAVDSDWDIAVRWQRGLSFMTILAATESLRSQLASALQMSDDMIDLIDISTARLAMRAVIVEEGVPLKGGDSIVWNRLLSRTWRELEEFYWESVYAA